MKYKYTTSLLRKERRHGDTDTIFKSMGSFVCFWFQSFHQLHRTTVAVFDITIMYKRINPCIFYREITRLIRISKTSTFVFVLVKQVKITSCKCRRSLYQFLIEITLYLILNLKLGRCINM